MADHIVFDGIFFDKHQKKLLTLLNSPVVGRAFRNILGISNVASSVGDKRISKIEPHAIWWAEETYEKVEVRTHCKFSKRLYYSFKPLWWTMHYWDEMFADRLIPQLSFGFETLTYFPKPKQTAGSGQNISLVNGADSTVSREASPSETWAAVRGSGNYVAEALTSLDFSIGTGSLAQGSNKFLFCRRAILLFDTSLLGGARTIISGNVAIRGASKGDTLGWNPDLDLYGSSTTNINTVTTSDYGTIGSTSFTGSPITYASFDDLGWNTFVMNGTGLAAINQTGVSKFGIKNANYDAADISPTPWSQLTGSTLTSYSANQSGTSLCPTLTLVLTASINAPVITSAVGGVRKNTITWTHS